MGIVRPHPVPSHLVPFRGRPVILTTHWNTWLISFPSASSALFCCSLCLNLSLSLSLSHALQGQSPIFSSNKRQSLTCPDSGKKTLVLAPSWEEGIYIPDWPRIPGLQLDMTGGTEAAGPVLWVGTGWGQLVSLLPSYQGQWPLGCAGW